MSGKSAKRDRKLAKAGAQMLMEQLRSQWKNVIRPKPRWIPAGIWLKLVHLVLNTDQIPQ